MPDAKERGIEKLGAVAVRKSAVRLVLAMEPG